MCTGVFNRRSAAVFGSFMSDIRKALPVIVVCGGIVSLVLGFVWLVLVKWFGGAVLLCCVVLCPVCACASVFVCVMSVCVSVSRLDK